MAKAVASTDIARAIHDAHRIGLDFWPLRVAGETLAEDRAYEVQEHLVARLCGELKAEVIGYKIGLTSAVMQKMCGIGSPVYGAILDNRRHASGAAIRLGNYGRLGIEFEIAVRLNRDLSPVPASWATVADSVDAIAPAFELIDDRHADYAHLDGASLIADNGWSAGLVLGEWQPAPADLARRRGRAIQNGAEIDRGLVGDAYEHPFAAVHWVAQGLARRGKLLRAGMVVMTGSVVKTRFPAAGERWRYEVEGLGAVEASFA
jgi:2-keto-4-pentenoate hydratase